MTIPDWLARAAVVFGTALGYSWLLTALLIRLLPRVGLVDYPGERKVHTHPTPRGGGLAVFLAVLLSPPWLGWDIYHMPAIVSRLQWLLAFLIVFVGLLDDQRPLSWKLRLAVQLAVCIAAVFVCLPKASWLVRACAVLWIAMLINAFNMLDNMDALSGGVAWIVAGFLAAASLPASADWERYIALMGALAGFLWYNWPPARIFLGDAGSTFLGFTLGLGSADMALRQPDPVWASIAPLCILAVPCYDLVSVVLLRLSQGRSPFHADKQHLSHRLVGRGLSSRTAVRVIYLLALASGMSGLAFLQTGSLWIIGQLALWWIALAVMEFAVSDASQKR